MSAKCHFIIKAWPSWSNRFMWLFSSQHATIQYIWHIRRTPGDIHLSRGGRLQGFRFYQTLLTELILGGKKKKIDLTDWFCFHSSATRNCAWAQGLRTCLRAAKAKGDASTKPLVGADVCQVFHSAQRKSYYSFCQSREAAGGKEWQVKEKEEGRKEKVKYRNNPFNSIWGKRKCRKSWLFFFFWKLNADLAATNNTHWPRLLLCASHPSFDLHTFSPHFSRRPSNGFRQTRVWGSVKVKED